MPVDSRPNFLWICLEDCPPIYTCHGDPIARTPHLDLLASQGCLYRNAFSTAGVCAPARSAIITGMYPISIGTMHMRTGHRNRYLPRQVQPYSAVIPHYVKCIPEYLRRAGYYCFNNNRTDYQFDPPFTAWDDNYFTEEFQTPPRQPFFAVYNFGGTHESQVWDSHGRELTFDADQVEVPPYYPDTPKVREAFARMYANLERSDQLVGTMLDRLEKLGLAQNTIVVNFSDHSPFPRGKRWTYDSGIHVPLIVRWPGQLKPGTQSDEMIGTIDLGPTSLSLAGLDVPRHIQGRVFLGPRRDAPREFIYASRDRHDEAYDMVRAVRDRKFKYIRNYWPDRPYLSWIPYRNKHPVMQEMWRCFLEGRLEGAQEHFFRNTRSPEELYDIQADPHEVNNLSTDPKYHPDLVRMREALNEWIADVGDLGEVPELELVNRWYPDGHQPVTEQPICIPLSGDKPGLDIAREGGAVLKAPAKLQIDCSTQGASIGYTCDVGENPHWKLYCGPIELPVGKTRLRAKAIRYGYRESETLWTNFTVEP